MLKMVVYLGNTGSQYAKTRHNIGFMFHNHIYNNISLKSKFSGLYHQTSDGIVHIMPSTMMNRSGETVSKAASFFKVEPEETLIVYDDLEIPFGSYKIRKGGGLKGHNGLKSISEKCRKGDFCFLGIGISRPKTQSVSSYVLSRFPSEEEMYIEDIFNKIIPDYNRVLDNSFSNYNKKIKTIDQLEG